MEGERNIPVIRHGQFDGPGAKNRTYDNFVRSLADESRDYPLTEAGKSQVLEMLKRIPNYKQIDLILASEFLRTRQSAQVISDQIKSETGHSPDIISSELLNTIWMPPDSLSEEEFRALEKTDRKNAVADAMFQKWTEGQIGETPEMVEGRINAFLLYLKDLLEYKASFQPVIVTHASFSSAMQRYIQGTSLTSPRNEEQILKVAGYYYLSSNGDMRKDNIKIISYREMFMA